MPTVITTVGGSTSNSYSSVAEADAYFESVLYADDWDGADTGTQERALIYATLLLDSKYDWAGNQTTLIDEGGVGAGQRLAWPRNGVIDADGLGNVDENVIPRQLKYATAEFAKQLIVSNRTANNDVETQGITSLGVGPISLSFKDSVKSATQTVVPDAVRMLLPPWWGKVRGNALTWAVLRG
jgi:hypothetical protein